MKEPRRRCRVRLGACRRVSARAQAALPLLVARSHGTLRESSHPNPPWSEQAGGGEVAA